MRPSADWTTLTATRSNSGARLAERLERALDHAHPAHGLRREGERDARELPLGDQHARTGGQRGGDQADQRGHRRPDRDPVHRHPDQVGERGTARGDGRVEVGRPRGAAAPVVDRGGHRVGGAGRWDADARRVEVAVGDVELPAESGAHGVRRYHVSAGGQHRGGDPDRRAGGGRRPGRGDRRVPAVGGRPRGPAERVGAARHGRARGDRDRRGQRHRPARRAARPAARRRPLAAPARQPRARP